MKKNSLFLLIPLSSCKGLMYLSLLIFHLLSISAKSNDTSMGFSVYYPRYAKTGQEVSFSFATRLNIHRIRVFVNGSSLGSTYVSNNHAEFRFKFVYASIKKLKFVGFSPDNNTLSEIQGEITIGGKNQFSQAIKYEYTNAGLPPSTTDKSYSSNSGSVTTALSGANVVYPNPNTPSFSEPFDENNKALANVYPYEQPTNEVAWTFFSSIQNEVIPLAHKYRVPASVIMAMAALESGYGYSKTATIANNYFGIKQWKPSADGFQLKGQADEHNGKVRVLGQAGQGQYIYDEARRKDNWYRSFKSRSECIRFLIEEVFLHKTGLWKRDYSGAVRDYHSRLDRGFSKYDAAYQFAFQLGAKGYNHLGGRYYADRTIKIIEKYNLLSFD
ncbi:glucosaminidase domain-containing protein [Flectobacillus sp. DC10W]|uniref:Glucosaminidase domain-containing protein n=1 Tax=Flectobacillus longus TaxID=2984207 RepID=A0ABT6YK82_9BACT|nr:glucosaminidase domain-containing protein [Flectobacillus longus]MDI9863548.1 glucosaminidase domain-containing protein [Flectobacillus longus]